MSEITLKRSSTGWTATFSGDAAREIWYLFKTDTIPTAYTADAPAAKVQRLTAALWPDCEVKVECRACNAGLNELAYHDCGRGSR